MSGNNEFIPRDLVEAFARTPEAQPTERRRRGGRYRPYRHALTPDDRRAMFEAQDGRCYYCRLPFGTLVYRRGKPQTLEVTQDHWLPYSKFRQNGKDIMVLACNLCNMFKTNNYFKDEGSLRAIDVARAHIRERFIRKGYSLAAPGLPPSVDVPTILVGEQVVYALEVTVVP